MNTITLQNECGEEFNVELPQEDYEKIVAGDYNLANSYLQKAEERKNRLLAFQLLLKDKPKTNLCRGSSSSSQPENKSKSYASTSSSGMESNILDTVQYESKETMKSIEHVDALQNLMESEDVNNEISQRWSDIETKLLIDLLRMYIDKFNDKKYKVKTIYQEMAKQLPRFTAEQVESKIKNLKKTYKSILDNNKRTGRGRINWPYFDAFQNIFGKKPENSPLSIASNRSGFVVYNTSGPSTDVDGDTESGRPSKKKARIENSTRTSNIDDVSSSLPTDKGLKKYISNAQPEWIKEFRNEMANRHKEKMEKQEQFLNIFKDWVYNSKDK